MIKKLFILFSIFGTTVCASEYSFVSGEYSYIADFNQPCSAPSCVNYSSGMRVTGSFVTNSPLSPNLSNQDISGLLSSWTFSDGVHRISSSDQQSVIFSFTVDTDGGGNLTIASIYVQQWQQTPQSGAFFNLIEIIGNSPGAFNAVECTHVAGSICGGWRHPNSTSSASTRTPGFWIQSTGPLSIASPAYNNLGVIPNPFTFSFGGQCNGNNWSPPLEFANIPAGTQGLAIVMEDLTFPWLHWLAYNVPANTTTLPYNASATALFPQAQNDFTTQGYGGPCPPAGQHIYAVTVYAVNTSFNAQPTIGQIQAAAIQQASLLGTRSDSDNVPWNPPSPPGPNPIPTLSEWAKILMMLMMIGTVGWYSRKLTR